MKKAVVFSAAVALVVLVAFGGLAASAAPYVKGDSNQITKDSGSAPAGKCAAGSSCCEMKGKDAAACKDKSKGDCASCKAKTSAKEHKHAGTK